MIDVLNGLAKDYAKPIANGCLKIARNLAKFASQMTTQTPNHNQIPNQNQTPNQPPNQTPNQTQPQVPQTAKIIELIVVFMPLLAAKAQHT